MLFSSDGQQTHQGRVWTHLNDVDRLAVAEVDGHRPEGRRHQLVGRPDAGQRGLGGGAQVLRRDGGGARPTGPGGLRWQCQSFRDVEFCFNWKILDKKASGVPQSGPPSRERAVRDRDDTWAPRSISLAVHGATGGFPPQTILRVPCTRRNTAGLTAQQRGVRGLVEGSHLRDHGGAAVELLLAEVRQDGAARHVHPLPGREAHGDAVACARGVAGRPERLWVIKHSLSSPDLPEGQAFVVPRSGELLVQPVLAYVSRQMSALLCGACQSPTSPFRGQTHRGRQLASRPGSGSG